MCQVIVSSDDASRVEKMLRALKRKSQKEGVPRELKKRRFAEKRSDKKRKKQQDAARRQNRAKKSPTRKEE